MEPVSIPLFSGGTKRPGSGRCVGYAVVDADDAPDLLLHRWCMRRSGRTHYAERSCGHTKVQMHRELLGLPLGDPREGDHRNGDGLDNRRDNLRILTRAQNAQNLRARTDGRSRFRGVVWSKARLRWLGRIDLRGRAIHVGSFLREEDAAIAVSRARADIMPFSERDTA